MWLIEGSPSPRSGGGGFGVELVIGWQCGSNADDGGHSGGRDGGDSGHGDMVACLVFMIIIKMTRVDLVSIHP